MDGLLGVSLVRECRTWPRLFEPASSVVAVPVVAVVVAVPVVVPVVFPVAVPDAVLAASMMATLVASLDMLLSRSPSWSLSSSTTACHSLSSLDVQSKSSSNTRDQSSFSVPY